MKAAIICMLAIATTSFGQVVVTPIETIDTGSALPARLAATAGGGIYATSQDTGEVLEYDAAGTLIGTYAVPELPVGIATHPDGRVFVSRRDGVIGIYDSAFTFLGALDPLSVPVTAPNDIAIDAATGEIYVTDSEENRVLVFDGVTNALVRAWGSIGSSIGQFRSPQAIAFDTGNNLVYVTDVDNFRVQAFSPTGIFQFKFGYKLLYIGMDEVAWFARSEGLAIDACGDIYVADALMGTVRAFSPTGTELDPQFDPVITYGAGSGMLQVPCDILIAGDTMYVASTYKSAVEVYEVSCTLRRGGDKKVRDAKPKPLFGDASSPFGPEIVPPAPDNPFDIVVAMDSGSYDRELDLNKDRRITVADLDIAVRGFGAATVDDFLEMRGDDRGEFPVPLQPPHLIDYEHACGRCHSMDGLPGGMLSVEGQENLCLSCHTGGGRAMAATFPPISHGLTHPVGVPADSGDVNGPAPDTELSYHLDNGDIRCATCHDPHDLANGENYLRFAVEDSVLCGECHGEEAEWRHAGHSDWTSQSFTYPIGENRRACVRCHSGLGFIDFAAGIPQEEQRVDMQVIACFVCHQTHGTDQVDLLRIYDEVSLPGGNELTDAGPDATCMACHNGRIAPGEGTMPHYAIGGVMLEGVNGIDFGATLHNSAHAEVATCVACHMAASPAEGSAGTGKVGGHSFNMVVHDPGDPDYGFENVESACNSTACHGATGALTTMNRTGYGDYDGDGVVEGVQDETGGLMGLLYDELIAAGAVYLGHHPYWDFSGVIDDPPGFLQIVKDCVWNYEYVDNSGDLGIHNTGYAVGLLQVSYEVLTGEAIDGADLRYDPIGFSPTVVEIQQVNGGAPVQTGGAFTVDFTIEDGQGNALPIETLNRVTVYVSGPTYHYQRVIASDSNWANFAQNPDGSYTYTAVNPFPSVYAAPPNDSPAFDFDDGEWTGLALVEGTYTVLIESRRVFGSIRKAGDATFDFIVADDPGDPPAIEPRQFVMREICNNCHNDLQLHGSNRFAVTGCVICHVAGSEDVITDPESTPGLTVEFGEMIHRLHRGHDLANIRATQNGADPYRYIIRGHGGSENDFSDIGFPMIPKAVTACDACHAGATQGQEIYTNLDCVTRSNCVGCHDDLDFPTGSVLNFDHPDVAAGLLTQDQLMDPAYRYDMNHEWVDGQCFDCHGDSSVIGPRRVHRHPTEPEEQGTDPVLEILSVGGMTGGGGSYFVAGDVPEVTFKLRDINNDPLQIVPGNQGVIGQLEFYVAGPTTLVQQIMGAQRAVSNGNIAAPPERWIDNFAVDGTYTLIFSTGLPANYPAQPNALGEPPAEQIFSYEGGWGQQYTAGGTPLHNGTYLIVGFGRRVIPVINEREWIETSIIEFPFGADEPLLPKAFTATTESCNACHGEIALHGFQRYGLESCIACHTAGSQDGGTYESVDLRIMVHKLHNARNLTNQPYELAGHSGIVDFSHLLISSMPGEAAECAVCHVDDQWKSPPVRDNMRTWMAACTSCHDADETMDHADMMTVPGTFEEMCALCHGEGMLFSVEHSHAAP